MTTSDAALALMGGAMSVPYILVTLIALCASLVVLPNRRIVSGLLAIVLILRTMEAVAALLAQAGLMFGVRDLGMSSLELSWFYGLEGLVGLVTSTLIYALTLLAIFGFRSPPAPAEAPETPF